MTIHVMTWDWKAQPDMDELGRVIREMTGGKLLLHQVDTDSDEYAIVLSTTPLNAAEIAEIYQGEWWA